MGDSKRELLEIYKLHAELADRVSQRREGANRVYVTLLTVVSLVLSAFLVYGPETISASVILAIGIIGALLSASWYVVVRSYRQLNTGKLRALSELEENLSYPFFEREWALLGEGKETKKYWKLTVVETFLPAGFFALSVFLILASFAVR